MTYAFMKKRNFLNYSILRRIGVTDKPKVDRSKVVAIVTGALSVLLAIAYLLLVQILDFRGEMVPAPVSFLGFFV